MFFISVSLQLEENLTFKRPHKQMLGMNTNNSIEITPDHSSGRMSEPRFSFSCVSI